MPKPIRIVRVVRVEDTREWEEGPDERWHPIPGSGRIHECARCGKDHEVWAEVELSDHSVAVVGTGCAARDSLDIATQIHGLPAKAKRLARMRAELASQHAAVARYRAVVAEVERLRVPEPEYGEIENEYSGRLRVVRVGDQQVILHGDSGYERQGAVESARLGWRERRLKERGIKYPHPRVDETLTRKIAALERELGQ